VVIVTHRMADVAAAADRVTVLRQARTVLSGEEVGNRTKAELARLMVGDDAPASIGIEAHAVPAGVGSPVGGSDGGHPSGPVLRVSGLTLGRLREASFTVAPGQVVGIAGVDGNGQAELEAALSGRTPAEAGTVELGGEALTLREPGERIAAGIAYITSDRYRWGLVLQLDLADNLHLGRLPRWLPSRRARREAAGPKLEQWDVRGNGPATRAGALSGGNAQKVVLARELDGDVHLVLACHATRGLDPEAASTVARRVLERAAEGAGVVWVGAELDELFAVADALLVAVDGRLVGPFHPPYDRQEIGLVMAGAGSAGGARVGDASAGGSSPGAAPDGAGVAGEVWAGELGAAS
jgi:general nucleoside transport system ATP-binding protein